MSENKNYLTTISKIIQMRIPKGFMYCVKYMDTVDEYYIKIGENKKRGAWGVNRISHAALTGQERLNNLHCYIDMEITHTLKGVVDAVEIGKAFDDTPIKITKR